MEAVFGSHFVRRLMALDDLCLFFFTLLLVRRLYLFLGGPQKNGEDLALIARLSEAESGRTMEVFGSQPSVQVYTANYLSVGELWCLPLSVS